MCGIYGFLGSGELPPMDGLPARMDRLLAHRGPDSHGLEQLPDAILGHRRLSIIDLSPAGRQPMWDARRQVCIVYNGEIYNYRELGAECRRAGLELRSRSDTEVILALFLMLGEAAFDRLQGIFAFCLYDARDHVSYLVRDPIGVKPLYYAETRHGLCFASELKALTHSGLVPLQIDQAALQAYLQLDYVPAPLSIVSGVCKLREGYRLRVAGGSRNLSRYTSLPEATTERSGSLEEDSAELDRLIRQAVRAQLVADVPLGVFLSGGVDSSLIAAVAAQVAGCRIRTFSIGFEDPSFDESGHFNTVASAIGSEHHVEILQPATMLELLTRMPQVVCEPLADGSVYPTFLLSRFARQQVTVALSGDGADELFAGYPTYRAARLVHPLRWLPRWTGGSLSRLAHTLLPVSHRNLSFDFRVKKLLDGLHPDPVLRNARWLGSFLPGQLPHLLLAHQPQHQPLLEEMLHEPAAAAAGSSPLEQLLRTDQRFYLQDDLLVKVDRTSMAHALEVRVPYLDPAIVAFARQLPPHRKLQGSRSKLLLKHCARKYLPVGVLRRPKKGFGIPLGHWFRGELRDLVGDVLGRDSVRRAGFFRPDTVTRLLTEHWSGRRDHRKLIFNLLTFSLWYDSLPQLSPTPCDGGNASND